MFGWQLGVRVSHLSPPRRRRWRVFRRTVGQQSRNRALPHLDEQKAPHYTISRIAQIERRQKVEVGIPETVLKDDVRIRKLLNQLKCLIGQPSIR